MDMSLSKLGETVMDREAWWAASMGSQRVGHGWVTEQQQSREHNTNFKIFLHLLLSVLNFETFFFFNLCYFKKLHLEKVMRAVLFKFGLQSVLWKSVFKRGWRFGLLLTPTHVWTWMRKQETRSRKQVSGLSDLPSPEMWVLEERNLTGKILFINIKQWFKMNHKHLRFC